MLLKFDQKHGIVTFIISGKFDIHTPSGPVVRFSRPRSTEAAKAALWLSWSKTSAE
jgi:hypothetical protein